MWGTIGWVGSWAKLGSTSGLSLSDETKQNVTTKIIEILISHWYMYYLSSSYNIAVTFKRNKNRHNNQCSSGTSIICHSCLYVITVPYYNLPFSFTQKWCLQWGANLGQLSLRPCDRAVVSPLWPNDRGQSMYTEQFRTHWVSWWRSGLGGRLVFRARFL